MNGKLFNFLAYLLLIITSLLITEGCDSSRVVDNPPPFVEITNGPDDGEIINVNYVSFSWIGSDNSIEFKYRLLTLDEDNFPTVYVDWSEYSKTTDVTFDNLDESKYRFEVMARSEGQEEGPVSRVFTVDAFRGPTMSFFKTETEMSVGDTAYIDTWLEDVDSLTAVHMVIAFDPNYLQFIGIEKGDFPERESFELITVPNFSDSSVVNEVNSLGKIEINTALLATIYTLPRISITGSGSLLRLKFRALLAGTTKLNYTLIEFQNEAGNTFTGNPPKEGVVIISAK